MVLTLHREMYCPKDRQQLAQLLPFAKQCTVGFTQLVGVSADNNLFQVDELRLGVGADWPFLYDQHRVIAKNLGIEEYTDSHDKPMIPHTFVLEPGLRISKTYNGYWYWGRPSTAELHEDQRQSGWIRLDWRWCYVDETLV